MEARRRVRLNGGVDGGVGGAKYETILPGGCRGSGETSVKPPDNGESRGRAEEALRERKDRFRLMVGGVEDHAVFMLDPEGRIKGYDVEETAGEHFSHLSAAWWEGVGRRSGGRASRLLLLAPVEHWEESW